MYYNKLKRLFRAYILKVSGIAALIVFAILMVGIITKEDGLIYGVGLVGFFSIISVCVPSYLNQTMQVRIYRRHNIVNMEEFSKDVLEGEKIGHVYLGKEGLAIIGDDHAIAQYNQLLWVYPTEFTYPMVVRQGITFITRDGLMYKARLKDEEEVILIMNEIYNRIPYIFYGYNEEWKNGLKKNLESMNYVINQRKKAM